MTRSAANAYLLSITFGQYLAMSTADRAKYDAVWWAVCTNDDRALDADYELVGSYTKPEVAE